MLEAHDASLFDYMKRQLTEKVQEIDKASKDITLSSKFGSIGLLFDSQYKKMARENKTLYKRSYCGNECIWRKKSEKINKPKHCWQTL